MIGMKLIKMNFAPPHFCPSFRVMNKNQKNSYRPCMGEFLEYFQTIFLPHSLHAKFNYEILSIKKALIAREGNENKRKKLIVVEIKGISIHYFLLQNNLIKDVVNSIQMGNFRFKAYYRSFSSLLMLALLYNHF